MLISFAKSSFLDHPALRGSGHPADSLPVNISCDTLPPPRPLIASHLAPYLGRGSLRVERDKAAVTGTRCRGDPRAAGTLQWVSHTRGRIQGPLLSLSYPGKIQAPHLSPLEPRA